MRLCYLAIVAAALAEDRDSTSRDLDDATLRLIRHASPFQPSEKAKLSQLPARFSRCATQLAYFDVPVSASINRRGASLPRLNRGLHAIDATPARWRGGSVAD
jgi:hypothetical protein